MSHELTPPAWAKAMIVAECEHDRCESMSDYYATETSRIVFLGWSKHTRDLFPELRKAAARFQETEHLGPNLDVWTARVVLDTNLPAEGHWRGGYSPWHSERFKGSGSYNCAKFMTEAAAQTFVDAQPPLEPIWFGDTEARFRWDIRRTSVEHREKYSMGHGYYLKASGRYDSGWLVRKTRIPTGTVEMEVVRNTHGKTGYFETDEVAIGEGGSMRRLKGRKLTDWLTRYRLPSGWFIDRATVRAHQYYGYRYTLWEPGASPTGTAAFRGGSDTLRGMLAIVDMHYASGVVETETSDVCS